MKNKSISVEHKSYFIIFLFFSTLMCNKYVYMKGAYTLLHISYIGTSIRHVSNLNHVTDESVYNDYQICNHHLYLYN